MRLSSSCSSCSRRVQAGGRFVEQQQVGLAASARAISINRCGHRRNWRSVRWPGASRRNSAPTSRGPSALFASADSLLPAARRRSRRSQRSWYETAGCSGTSARGRRPRADARHVGDFGAVEQHLPASLVEPDSTLSVVSCRSRSARSRRGRRAEPRCRPRRRP